MNGRDISVQFAGQASSRWKAEGEARNTAPANALVRGGQGAPESRPTDITLARPSEMWNGEGGPELDQEPARRFRDPRLVLDTGGNEPIQEGTLRDEVVAPASTTCGFVKLTRNPEVWELIKANPSAFVLATVIALRARWKPGFNAHGLDVGEAFLGDFKEYGLTRQRYRTAMRKLREARFATFKSTHRGTVAKLLDSRLYDLPRSSGNHHTSHQPASRQPAGSQQATTNEKGKKGNKGKKRQNFIPRSAREKAFLSGWAEAYESQFGRSYVDNGDADTVLARRLLTSLRDSSPESLVQLAQSAWDGEGYWCARAYSLRAFVNQFNEIQAELSGLCPSASGL